MIELVEATRCRVCNVPNGATVCRLQSSRNLWSPAELVTPDLAEVFGEPFEAVVTDGLCRRCRVRGAK